MMRMRQGRVRGQVTIVRTAWTGRRGLFDRSGLCSQSINDQIGSPHTDRDAEFAQSRIKQEDWLITKNQTINSLAFSALMMNCIFWKKTEVNVSSEPMESWR